MEKDKKQQEIERTTSICYFRDDPERVDSFLIRVFTTYSRTYFQKLLKTCLVTVNGKSVNKSFLVSQGDEVVICFPKPPSIKIEPQYVEFEVVDTQDDFLVIDKPAGLVVHDSKEKASEPTLVSGLLYRFKEFSEFDDTERPGIVHRLDRNTTGIIVVARNIKAQIELSGLFRRRLMEKRYLAVVKGHPDPEGKIDLPVGRHPVERNKMSHVSYTGKPALTHYKVLQYYGASRVSSECSLVEVRIVTGRTHQIRVHFAAIGHGLLGDGMYGIKSKLINRQALHSWKLSFEFGGRHYDYWCPVPEDFRRLLYFLREQRVEPY